jgi:HK97 family phage prohead protease
MLVQHGGAGLTAQDLMPVGRWTSLSESDDGLVAEGKLAHTPRGKEAYELMRMGALDGLSIGYVARDWEMKNGPNGERRVLKGIDLSEISLVMNWAHNANEAVQKGYTRVMMLESDVLFEENFLEKLENVFHILGSQPFDFLSISGRDDLRPKRVPGDTSYQWFHHPGYYHTRTTDAMIFQVSMLQKILGTLFTFAEVLDWELKYQLSLHSSQSFWLDTPICRQGSGK